MTLKCNVLHGVLYPQVHGNGIKKKNWKEPQKINRRIAREVMELSEYNIKLKNIPGRENGRADMLSR